MGLLSGQRRHWTAFTSSPHPYGLIAAESLVFDPVAIAFDAARQMYVAEDRGYPDPVEGGLPSTLGRVALLKDTKGSK